jgi:FdhD protein
MAVTKTGRQAWNKIVGTSVDESHALLPFRSQTINFQVPRAVAHNVCGGGFVLARKAGSVGLTQVSEWDDGKIRRKNDYLAAEEPLEIRVGHEPISVTMRTPGHDLELAAGFLFTEGLVQKYADIISLQTVGAANAPNGLVRGSASSPDAGQNGAKSENVVRTEIAPDVAPDLEHMRRNFFAASSCGICGKASIEAIRSRCLTPPNPDFRLDAEILVRLPEILRSFQDVFERTGGLHAAALFNSAGELLVLREDIGRHNAVDKVIGWALREERVPIADCVLLVSGRGGFEIVQKAIVAGLPVVASVSAPSSLAVQLARELRLTLIGFLRGRRFVIYSGEERIQRAVGHE